MKVCRSTRFSFNISLYNRTSQKQAEHRMLWVEYLWLQWSKVGHVDVHKEVNVVLRILAEDKKDVGHVEIIFDGGYLKKTDIYCIRVIPCLCLSKYLTANEFGYFLFWFMINYCGSDKDEITQIFSLNELYNYEAVTSRAEILSKTYSCWL